MEVDVQDRLQDIQFCITKQCWLSKKYAYIYDNSGIEIHCLKHHLNQLGSSFAVSLSASVCRAHRIYKVAKCATGDLVYEARTKWGTAAFLTKPI